jgi:N utilization substance protein A
MERGNVVVGIGKAEAILPRREQVQGENYRFGDTLYVYVVEVRSNYRGPSITVSRTHPNLVRQLFVLEVPEIAEDIVELKAVAREAGQRTKIAVAANNPDVDPVGACVGPRGMRVGKVVGELGNEKVDIVRWSADPISFISNALSPAQISKVILLEKHDNTDNENREKGTATVIVAEDQQSLAIGKQGQNVRLAAKLTDWRIDIRTEKQYAEEQAKKMFAGDLEAPIAVSVRESPDELAGIFSTTVANEGEDEAASALLSTDTLTEDALFEGTASPIGDIELFPVETEADGLPQAGEAVEGKTLATSAMLRLLTRPTRKRYAP